MDSSSASEILTRYFPLAIDTNLVCSFSLSSSSLAARPGLAGDEAKDEDEAELEDLVVWWWCDFLWLSVNRTSSGFGLRRIGCAYGLSFKDKGSLLLLIYFLTESVLLITTNHSPHLLKPRHQLFEVTRFQG